MQVKGLLNNNHINQILLLNMQYSQVTTAVLLLNIKANHHPCSFCWRKKQTEINILEIDLPWSQQDQLSSPLARICWFGKESVSIGKKNQTLALLCTLTFQWQSKTQYTHLLKPLQKTKIFTSFIIIAILFVLESSNSTSVFPLTTIRPFPLRYASTILDKKSQISGHWSQISFRI